MEQLPQSDQLDHLPLIGHGCALHACACWADEHALPPCLATTSPMRVRDCWPLPHCLVHVLHLPHVPSTQSIGHGLALQARVSVVDGHAAPPNWGATSPERVRDCEPGPHFVEQLLQPPLVPFWQAIGLG